MFSKSCSAEKLVGALVMAAVLHQILNHTRSVSFTLDECFQTIGARSLLQGHGISLVYASPQDWSKPVIEPLVGWPPGFSLVIAALLWLRNDVSQAFFIIKTAATALFFASWWFILRDLRDTIGLLARVATFAWWAFVASPLRRLPCSDMLSLGLFCAGIAVSLVLFRQDAWHIKASLFAGSLIGSAAALRYAYWPLVIVVPICLTIAGVRFRRRFLMAALVQMAVATSFVGFAAIYTYRTTRHPTYLTQYYSGRPQGAYPRQLGRIVPFPAEAVGLDEDLSSIYSRLSTTKTLARVLTPLLWLLSARIYLPDLIVIGLGHDARQLLRDRRYLPG